MSVVIVCGGRNYNDKRVMIRVLDALRVEASIEFVVTGGQRGADTIGLQWVLRPDQTWAPFVGSWEHGKEPDGRHVETHPYNYLLRDGEVQRCTAAVHVERRIWRLRHLPFIRRSRTSIDVSFSDEMGEGRGSWKGGTVGCGYDLRVNETPRECLKRMERERRFDR